MHRLLAVPRSTHLSKGFKSLGLGLHVAKSLTSQQHLTSPPIRYFSSPPDDLNKNEKKEMHTGTGTGTGLIDKFFGKEATEASPDFSNRWAIAVPAFVTHMCIGSPWAWSLMVCHIHNVHII